MEFTNMVYDGKVFLGLCIFFTLFIWGKTIWDIREIKKKNINKRIIEKLNRNFKYKGQI
jgi:hypothetical protein